MPKKTTIGGQALIEGIMMIGPKDYAIAIRKPEGDILVEKKPLPSKGRISKVPFVRGVVGLFRQMVLGIKALMYSAEFVDVEEDTSYKPSRFEMFIEKLLGDKFKDAAIYAAVILSLMLSIGLFILLPNVVANFITLFDKSTSKGSIYLNIFEGLIRVSIFLAYLSLASRMKDIRRVWEYHGAEHKTIHCYENDEELTVENVRKYSIRHPRCGTSFLFLVMIISIIIFSFTGWHNVFLNMLIRLALVPVVAGVSYEILRFAGRSNLKVMKLVNAPGKLFQYFTTKEPDDAQIEVAIEAFKNVMVEDKDADRW